MLISVTAFCQEGATSIQKSEKLDPIYESPNLEGIYGFRHQFNEVFNMDKVNGKGIIESEASFIVTSEGKITNVKATGTNISMNNEMERAITGMNKFKLIPKKLDGKPIDSRYRLPVKMTFIE